MTPDGWARVSIVASSPGGEIKRGSPEFWLLKTHHTKKAIAEILTVKLPYVTGESKKKILELLPTLIYPPSQGLIKRERENMVNKLEEILGE